MKIHSIAVVMVCAGALAACATPYQEMGIAGGVSGSRITSDTFQVVAKGNAYTDTATIQRYILRRAAELTLAAGYDYFVVGDPTDLSSTAHLNSAVVGFGRARAIGLGLSQRLFMPGEAVFVRAYRGKAPEPAPMGVYDAHEIEQYMGAQNVAVSITGKSTDAPSDHKNCRQVGATIKCD